MATPEEKAQAMSMEEIINGLLRMREKEIRTGARAQWERKKDEFYVLYLATRQYAGMGDFGQDQVLEYLGNAGTTGWVTPRTIDPDDE
jgi:hypothetical protein